MGLVFTTALGAAPGNSTPESPQGTPGQITAAHRTLPFGSWIEVTDLKNDRSVIVRINDRGPETKNRIIDLSYNAAKMLGMTKNGVHPVRIDLIETPTISENEGFAIILH